MLFLEETGHRGHALTQGGSLYDITVGTVVDINIHRMMLLNLHTAGDTGWSESFKHFKLVQKE